MTQVAIPLVRLIIPSHTCIDMLATLISVATFFVSFTVQLSRRSLIYKKAKFETIKASGYFCHHGAKDQLSADPKNVERFTILRVILAQGPC